jgi:hypothetical protein
VSAASVLGLASTIFSTVAALCLLNRPRFWWQEVVCNLSLYLTPLLIFSLLFNTRRAFQQGKLRMIALGGVLASGYSVYTIISAAVPFFHYARWPVIESRSAEELRVVFVDDCQLSQSQAREMLLAYRPDVAVIIGEARKSFFAEGTSLVNRSDFDGQGEISIASSLELRDRNVPNLGFHARAGGVVGVKLTSGGVIDLGVLSLRPSSTRSEFERNRISARRLASYMRSSDATRLVVGSFYATPFSQLVSVFTSQVRLRSLWYGRGMVKTHDMNHPYSHFTFSHTFVSRDVYPARVERLNVPGCSLAGLFAELRVKASAPQGNKPDMPPLTVEDSE